jgi:hypothetical protein
MQIALSVIARTVVSFVLLTPSFSAASDPALNHPKPYALTSWRNLSCRAKGRFQDRGYCKSAVIDQIVADGKSAIPVLISQITDSRRIVEPVYDYWQPIQTGELAHFILQDLFLDDTWRNSTMPQLFPEQHCDDAAWVCWGNFRKKHSLKELQASWIEFWKANEDRIFWDAKARCFRLADEKAKNSRR